MARICTNYIHNINKKVLKITAKNKNKLLINIFIIMIIGFSIGYSAGNYFIKPSLDKYKEKTAYQILIEGKARLELERIDN